MRTISDSDILANLERFDRDFFDPESRFKFIGEGELGGKARGLAVASSILAARFSPQEFPSIEISIPSLTVLRTGVFDAFVSRNGLRQVDFEEESDDSIARHFQRAEFPSEFLGDLRALIDQVTTPLAVRSSSLLEDALHEPFAGVYSTKMIPNNQASPDERFRKLIEAIKLVYASTWFSAARSYLAATRQQPGGEKMAVIIQEVVGSRFHDRFYPGLSGVARSYNYYPSGSARPEDGVASLALGLGKTIVDGDVSWTYCPRFPASPAPFGSAAELAGSTQTRFWAVNMGKPPEWDPIRETEYLVRPDLAEAEEDGALRHVASTFDPQAARISMGTGTAGPRVLDFALLLVAREIPVNDVVHALMVRCEEELGVPVEIEFAMSFDPHRFGLLQVRPMMVSSESVVVGEDELTGPAVLAGSSHVLGNGVIDDLREVVYVRPEAFEAKHTRRIAGELARINGEMAAKKVPYLLVGFGRWGSSDPWLGIPVTWGDVSRARVIVEVMRQDMNVELSQGSHFFHNLISFQVPYFSIPFPGRFAVDWAWLGRQTIVSETDLIRRVSVERPLSVRVDGRTGRGVILKA